MGGLSQQTNGILWMFAGIISKSMMFITTKLTDKQTHESALMVIFARSIVTFLGAYLISKYMFKIKPFEIND